MAYLAGEPLIDVVTLQADATTVVPGATWTVLYAQTQAGVAIPTMIEETASPGTYLITSETSAVGAHHRILSAVKDGQTHIFFGTRHVVSRGSPFEHYVGQPIEKIVFVGDSTGTGITGRTLTTETANDPNGDTFTLTQSAVSGVAGAYLVTVTPDLVGVWAADVVANTTPERRFRFEATVFDAGPASVGAPLTRTGRVTWQLIETHRGRVTWERLK